MNNTSYKNLILPFSILLVGLVISIVIAIKLYKADLKVQQQELELKANDLKFNIQNRLNVFQQFSKSSASFFMSSDTITREEWKEFITYSKVNQNLKGFQGVAFIANVSAKHIDAHIARFINEFSTSYQVYPKSFTNQYTPILYIEPLDDKNTKAVGFNISSNPVMRKAIEEARDFNETVLTGKVTLIQDVENGDQIGSIIYSPVYKVNKTLNLKENKRDKIIGWSAISFRINDFIKDLVALKNLNQENSIQIKIYDGTLINEESLMYNSIAETNAYPTTTSLISFALPVELNRKTWTLLVTQPSIAFLESKSMILLLFGTILSFLLSYLVYTYQNTARIANEIAKKLTLDLSDKNKELINKNVLLNESYNRLEQAKEKAEARELQLKTIADNFVNGMIYQAVAIDENQRKFSYVSETVNKLYGCSVDDALNNPNLIYSKIHPDDKEKVLRSEREALRKMTVFNIETRIMNPDGSIRWSYLISKPRIISGLVCWDGLEIDITERKNIELELIEAKELAEESERLKSAFLANMSHEIRTPMNSILGFTELLMNDNLAYEKKKQYHEIVHNSGKRLMGLISDIIDISKIDSHQLNLHYTNFNLNKLIDNLYTQFKISPKLKNLELTSFKSLTDSASFINSDENRLVQVLSNLLENAMKFTLKGSITFGYQHTENELKFFVKDTGVGIKEQDLKLIFDRFGQSENHINAIEGTGLGLSISKGIVENLGGKIWVESKINQGSTFFFNIPHIKADSKEIDHIEKELVKIENWQTKTLLIAEDEESNFLYLEAILEEQNLTILHAQNGKEAVDLFKNNPVDMVLMDFNMPIMSGLEATEKIRKINQQVPIIALTAYVMAEDKNKALEVGCNGFLSKPIEKHQLLETINSFLA